MLRPSSGAHWRLCPDAFAHRWIVAVLFLAGNSEAAAFGIRGAGGGGAAAAAGNWPWSPAPAPVPPPEPQAHGIQVGHRFPSLQACERAFERVEGESGGPEQADAEYEADPRFAHLAQPQQGGYVHDEDGRGIIVKQAPFTSNYRVLYRPPAGRSGKPSARKGWDYKLHGEDWDNFGQCGGPNQSPVDLHKYVGGEGQTKYLLWFDYYLDPGLTPASFANFVNDGHGLRYERPAAANRIDLGFVKIRSKEYMVTEYIFHAPSEHSLDGAVFPLELQIYHQSKKGNGTVAVGIFFREGPSNPFLAGIRDSLNGTAPTWNITGGKGVGKMQGVFPGAFDLESVLPKGNPAQEKAFYNYNGSLTQPPCTPGVDWWVLSSPITASRDEIRFIRNGIYASESMRHGNARVSMPLGARKISVGLTGFQHAVRGSELPGWEHRDEVRQPRGYNAGDTPWGEHWATIEGEPNLVGWHAADQQVRQDGPGPSPSPAPAPAGASEELPT